MTLVLGGIALAIWVYFLIGRGGFWRFREEPVAAMPSTAPASVAVVIPARDEAAVIAGAVRSLVDQALVIVVDDASSDGTAGIAREAGARVIAARPLPRGWTGKMWAVSEGVRAAGEAEYLLLTDADIVHAPGTVVELVARARAGGFDLVSYMARLHCGTFAEDALIPAFVFYFFLLYPPKWVANSKSATAGAAGGCILIRREALQHAGGIEGIHAAVIDDCALAEAVKRSGGRIWLGLGGRTLSVRVYEGFGAIGQMIARTAFTQLRYSAWLLAGTVVGLALTYLVPPALTIFASDPAARALGASAWLLMTALFCPAVRYYRRAWWWAPMLPAIAVFYMGATLWSAIAYWRGRGGMWKGRAAAGRVRPTRE